MRVLHINDHLAYKGGVEVYALSLIRSLRGRGLEVGFAFGSGDSEAHSPSFHVPSISSVSWGRHRQGRTEMDAVLQSYRPDVCHVHGVFNSGTLESCLDYGPTILHLHDYRYLCPSSGLYYRRGGDLFPRVLRPVLSNRFCQRVSNDPDAGGVGLLFASPIHQEERVPVYADPGKQSLCCQSLRSKHRPSRTP